MPSVQLQISGVIRQLLASICCVVVGPLMWVLDISIAVPTVKYLKFRPSHLLGCDDGLNAINALNIVILIPNVF